MREEMRSGTVYHVDSPLSVHPQTTQVHHVVSPLFQLCEPSLSPSIVSATLSPLHCFRYIYVDHLTELLTQLVSVP